MSAKASYHHGNLRRELMDEALRVIRDKGVEAASLRSIAANLGVSHAAPYHHFADRTALLRELAHEGMGLMDERMAAAETRAGDDPGERLLGIGLAYVTFAVERPDYYAVIASPELMAAEGEAASPRGDGVGAYAEGATDDRVEVPDVGTPVDAASPASDHGGEDGPMWMRLMRAVADCQGAGVLPPGDTLVLGVALWSMVHGLAELWRLGVVQPLPQAAAGLEPLARQVLGAAMASLRAAAQHTSAAEAAGGAV